MNPPFPWRALADLRIRADLRHAFRAPSPSYLSIDFCSCKFRSFSGLLPIFYDAGILASAKATRCSFLLQSEPLHFFLIGDFQPGPSCFSSRAPRFRSLCFRLSVAAFSRAPFTGLVLASPSDRAKQFAAAITRFGEIDSTAAQFRDLCAADSHRATIPKTLVSGQPDAPFSRVDSLSLARSRLRGFLGTLVLLARKNTPLRQFLDSGRNFYLEFNGETRGAMPSLGTIFLIACIRPQTCSCSTLFQKFKGVGDALGVCRDFISPTRPLNFNLPPSAHLERLPDQVVSPPTDNRLPRR